MFHNSLKTTSDIDPRRLWQFKLPHVELVNRHSFYCHLVRGKSVLHIGCTDHKELIDLKIKHNAFLHTKLIENAEIVHGIDIDSETIDYLRSKYGITNIFNYDITQPKSAHELLASYDFVLIPEVIEHILNLGTFLQAVKKFMSPKSELVIGTPNCLKIHNALMLFKGFEEANPDHKFYFSYSTLKSLLKETGFCIEKWHIYIHGNPDRRLFKYGIRNIESLIKSFLIEINPWFGDGIIVQARLCG